MRRLAVLLLLIVLPRTALAADPVLGLWQTPPDRKNLVSHIEVRPCGTAFCGRIKAAFDASGKPVVTKNVGRELFWDIKAKGDGVYEDGTVLVPLLNIKARASMLLRGRQLLVKACKGPRCDGQVWTRLK